MGPMPRIAPYRGGRRKSLIPIRRNSLTAHHAAARQMTNTRLAQLLRTVKELFKNSLSINTLAVLIDDTERESFELASRGASSERVQKTNPDPNQVATEAQESQAEELLDSNEDFQESTHAFKTAAPAAFSATGKTSLFGTTDKQSGLAASLPAAGNTGKSTAQAQIIETLNLGHAIIEHIDQYAASDTLPPAQTLAFIAQIDGRIESLRSSVEHMTQSGQLTTTVRQRLDFIVSMVNFMRHLLKLGIRPNIATSALSNKIPAKKLSQIKNNKLMRSVAALLKQELTESKNKAPANRIFLPKQKPGGSNEALKDPTFHAPGDEDESSQEPDKKAHTLELFVEGEEEENNPSAFDPVQQEKFKNEQEKCFQHEAEILRKGLIEIFNNNDIYLPEKYSDQILLFIIIDGLAVGTVDDSAYHYVLQNLVNRLPISKKITSFLKEKGRTYWKILQILKSLYLEDEMSLEEIEINLCKHANISHYEDKPAPAEMLKVARI